MFTYENWDGDAECQDYYDVVFTEDIGIFKVGEHVGVLTIKASPLLPNGYYFMSSTEEENNKMKKQKVKLIAVVE